MSATRSSSAWERYAWVAGIVFVLATVLEAVVGFTGVKINQNDAAAKIAGALADHRKRVLLLAYLSVLYAAAFPIYLSKLHHLLRGPADRAGFLAPLVLIGGTVFVVLHAVSDVGIYALLGAKLATYGAQHDHGLSYALYLLTFALDSVGDLFGSLFALATGVLVLRSGALPRWLGWTAILVGALLFLQAFTLGGVVASFGLGLDGVGFVLLLIFVLVSSIILLRRENTTSGTAPETA